MQERRSLMAKGKPLHTSVAVTPHRPKQPASKVSTPETSLLVMRLKELDREFARQTKQLTALTKKLAKKIADIPGGRKKSK